MYTGFKINTVIYKPSYKNNLSAGSACFHLEFLILEMGLIIKLNSLSLVLKCVSFSGSFLENSLHNDIMPYIWNNLFVFYCV